MTVQSTKPGLKRKVLLFHSYVMNQISQMLIINLGGLTLVLQSMFQIPCRVQETSRSRWAVRGTLIREGGQVHMWKPLGLAV